MNEATERELIERYEGGASLRQSAAAAGVDCQTAYRFLRRLGIMRGQRAAALNRWLAARAAGGKNARGG